MIKKFVLIISWMLVLACMGLIFFFSSQISEESSETSGQILEIVTNIIRPLIDDMPEIQQFDVTENIHVVIRKIAHAAIYMTLAFLSSNALYMHSWFFNQKKTDINKKRFYKFYRFIYKYTNSLISFFITVIYAVTDEFHQLFVDGRSGELRDVMIDSAGALTGIFIYILFVRIVLNMRKKSMKKKYCSDKDYKIKL